MACCTQGLPPLITNCLRIGVAGVLNEVLELVEVIIDQPSALKVCHGFQHIHSCGDESLTSLAVYFRNWHMFREYMNNITC